jgi:hypothetical protein
LQSNCTRIAPELQQKPSNCTQLQQNHIGWGGGDLQHEATQPRGTANWCNRLAKPPAPVIVPISLNSLLTHSQFPGCFSTMSHPNIPKHTKIREGRPPNPNPSGPRQSKPIQIGSR